MRLFTAIELPPSIKTELGRLVSRLCPLAKLSWSPVENLHITTKFLGEWPERRLDEVKHALAEVPVPGPFEIAVRGLGWFPNPRNPRVFWAGIESPPDLARLAHDTDLKLAVLGLPTETREYTPHLTLARRRDACPIAALEQAIAALPPQDFGSFRASSFFLYLSAGGKYTQLQEFPLA